MSTFKQFNLHPRVESGIDAAGFTAPTPIQQQTIAAAVSGEDVLGLAQTGTGKTAAFVLPILHRLLDGPRGHIRALIVAPTRELAEQINAEIGMLGRSTGLRSTTVYGGVGKAQQVRALRGRAEIVVACPGRLLDHLQQRDADLSRLEILVLDEADHMFDMGFLPSIRRIIKHVPEAAQRLLFSATMPDELRQLAQGVLNDPTVVEIGRAAPAQTVAHALYPVASQQKLALLKFVLRRDDARSALVFTRTKHGAKRLAAQLDRENFFVTSLQGNLSQNKRQQALDGFRDGKFHILVATDIAARGIDVSSISHVINYDIPSTGDAYTHRIGRTGRAERSGQAYTFVTIDDDKAVRTIERELSMRLQRVRLDGFDYQPEDASSAGESGARARNSQRGNGERGGSRGAYGGRGGSPRGNGQQGNGQQASGQHNGNGRQGSGSAQRGGNGHGDGARRTDARRPDAQRNEGQRNGGRGQRQRGGSRRGGTARSGQSASGND
jgi:ATP-dependent RNA helicase RhlE